MSVKVIAHPETKQVITESTKTPGFGTFRVDSEEVAFTNGFVNIQKRTAFVRGKLEDLAKMSLTANKTLPGKIIKRESYEPFYDGQSAKIYPDSHSMAGQAVLTNGRETYLEFVYTPDVNAQDSWVGEGTATASEEVQEALAEQTA